LILSDRDIRKALADGRLTIDPPCQDADIQPASLDIHLGTGFRVFHNHRYACIDPREKQDGLTELIVAEDFFMLHPGQFALANTQETITLSGALVGRVEGKSSIGRLGLIVHATAGYIDPGWTGRITLELSNVANLPIKLYPNMKIGQLSFELLSSPAERPYGHPDLHSKYKGQIDPTESKIYENFVQNERG